MATEIKTIAVTEMDVTQFSVNGKRVYKDMNGQWVAQEELTPAEGKAMRQHLTSIGEL